MSRRRPACDCRQRQKTGSTAWRSGRPRSSGAEHRPPAPRGPMALIGLIERAWSGQSGSRPASRDGPGPPSRRTAGSDTSAHNAGTWPSSQPLLLDRRPDRPPAGDPGRVALEDGDMSGDLASSGTICIALAPVPIIAMRLPARSTEGSHCAECIVGPAKSADAGECRAAAAG